MVKALRAVALGVLSVAAVAPPCSDARPSTGETLDAALGEAFARAAACFQ